jgi:hypothetical protein
MVPIQLKNFQPGGHADQEGHETEEGQENGSGGEHVVRPHRDGQGGYAERGVDQSAVAEDGFPAEHREDSVTMPKNGNATMFTSGWPKNQNRCCQRIAPPLAGSNTWDPKLPVGFQAEQGGGEYREGDQDEDRGGQDFPGEHRQPPHGHSGAAQADDGGDHVHRPEDGADPGDDQGHVPQIRADLR